MMCAPQGINTTFPWPVNGIVMHTFDGKKTAADSAVGSKRQQTEAAAASGDGLREPSKRAKLQRKQQQQQ